jgi:hypothetical protein
MTCTTFSKNKNTKYKIRSCGLPDLQLTLCGLPDLIYNKIATRVTINK